MTCNLHKDANRKSLGLREFSSRRSQANPDFGRRKGGGREDGSCPAIYQNLSASVGIEKIAKSYLDIRIKFSGVLKNFQR